ncbi:MAG TPA: hypothetical protein PLZ21_07100, partial [Armatimonadota bacterium]|nr:hypothetical protein [Armatimonadota bacterium]
KLVLIAFSSNPHAEHKVYLHRSYHLITIARIFAYQVSIWLADPDCAATSETTSIGDLSTMTASPTASVMEEDEEYDEYDDCYGSDEEYDNGDESLNNLKQLGTALLLYADDWDGKLPKMDDIESVEEALTPYIHNTEFINPHTGEFYKPNSILTLHKIAHIQNPAEMVTFYEPTPREDNTRGVVYLDGHVELVSEED